MTAVIIKGSEQTLTSTTGYLDSATYFDLSHRTAGTFASHREEIYRLFEAYLRLKKEYGGTDAPDRYVHILSHTSWGSKSKSPSHLSCSTQKLLRLMREMGAPSRAIDYV